MFSKAKTAAIAGFLFSTFLTVPAQAATTCVTKSTNHSGYIYTAFKTVGTCTWDVPFGISAVEMLVVAGGGGGGPRHAGGGGAGGVVKASSVALTNISTLSVTVGAGGNGAVISGSVTEATNGSNSSIAKSAGSGSLTTRTATGGGKGSQAAPSSGGSGGGAFSGGGAAGTAGQGNAGGNGGYTASSWYAGGGGGAGGAGSNGTSAGGGAGGVGTTWNANFTTTTATQLQLTDTSAYFGGGGGGGITYVATTVSGGAGGTGGGGAGGGTGLISQCGPSGSKGCNAIANTGGGGGGAGQQGATTDSAGGGNGGSGIVILRYTITENVQVSNYGPATACYWGAQMNYGFLFTAGTGNAVTKMRLQFAANTNDFQFEAMSIEFWTNSAGVAGSKVGTLRPSVIDASSTAAGASVATRVGTFTGSVLLSSATQYWFIVKGGGYTASMCIAAGMVTEANSWAMVQTSGEYNMTFDGSYRTWGLSFITFEMSTGTPDYLSPTITGPNSSTDSSENLSVDENVYFSQGYTADESVTWTIAGSDAWLFSIATTGSLTMWGKDYESPSDANSDNIYLVTITATDSGGNATSQDLLLTVANVNEAPNFVTGGGASSISVSVAENQRSILTYSGTDPETPTTLTWLISGGLDSSKFSIESTTGVLTFTVAPDYEVPTDSNTNNVYLVTIGLSDGSITRTQSLSVTITNVNENTSINKPAVSGVIYKGVTVTITVVADNPGKVRFFINGKKISTCLAIPTTGSAPTASASCSFKPSVQGVQTIAARLTPTNTNLAASTSPGLVITVLRRSTLR